MSQFDMAPGAQKDDSKKIEGVSCRDVALGCLHLKADVLIDSNNNITFTEDLDIDDEGAASFMREDSAQELFDAGILKKGNPSSSKSTYELAGDTYGGSAHLDKDELNNAIKNGKLELGIDEDGYICFKGDI